MPFSLTKTTARTTPASQLIEHIDDWVDLLMEDHVEPTFAETLGCWELLIVFPDYPWVPGVNVTTQPHEHDDVYAEPYNGDAHKYLLEKAKEKLKNSELKRLRHVATGPLTPFDWLTYAEGELGADDME